jgi:hypothetical protein
VIEKMLAHEKTYRLVRPRAKTATKDLHRVTITHEPFGFPLSTHE